MARKRYHNVYRLDSTGSELEAMVENVKNYIDEIEEEKSGEFIDELLSLGIDTAERYMTTMSETIYKKSKDGKLEPKYSKPLDMSIDAVTEDNHTGYLIASGEEAAFAEFGTGITYNPKGLLTTFAEQAGMDAIGEYGSGKGSKPFWGIGHKEYSRGHKANYALTNAILAMKSNARKIAKEVFDND